MWPMIIAAAASAYSANRQAKAAEAASQGNNMQADPRYTQALIDDSEQMRAMRAIQSQRDTDIWNMSRPYMEQELARSGRMAGIAEEEAVQSRDFKRDYYNPAIQREYAEAFAPEQQLEGNRRRVAGEAMADVQQNINDMQQQAQIRAAAYGMQSPAGGSGALVHAAAAKSGAGRQASQQEAAIQRGRKQSAAAAFSDDPIAQLQGASAVGGGVGRGARGLYDAGNMTRAASFDTTSALTAGERNRYQWATLANQRDQWQTGQDNASMAALSQLGYMAGRGYAQGGADGGEIEPGGIDNAYNFADGGEIDLGLGITGRVVGYADGGEIEDEAMEAEHGAAPQPALVRADGAVTQGDGSGGKLQGPGTGISDDIPAETESGEEIRVANGEYIIPTDVVEILGEDFFDNLVARLHTPAAIQRQQGAV